jgi:hypothetical protein
MDILHILYVDIEDEFTMYATTSLIHKVVLNTLVPYHMPQFFIGFNITNVSIWLDLYFNLVRLLLENLHNSNGQPIQIKEKKQMPQALALVMSPTQMCHHWRQNQ